MLRSFPEQEDTNPFIAKPIKLHTARQDICQKCHIVSILLRFYINYRLTDRKEIDYVSRHEGTLTRQPDNDPPGSA